MRACMHAFMHACACMCVCVGGERERGNWQDFEQFAGGELYPQGHTQGEGKGAGRNLEGNVTATRGRVSALCDLVHHESQLRLGRRLVCGDKIKAPSSEEAVWR